MQWLKKHFLQLRYSFIANYARRQLSKTKPNRQHCEDLLKELSVERFKQYQPSVGLGVSIRTRYPNIESFTQKLKETTRLIREEKMIPVDWVASEELVIPVDRFMTSSDGYYLDVAEAVAHFKAQGMKLCEEMKDSDTATFGLAEHNLRMLTKLFINLRDVTTTLIETSLA